MLNLKQKYYIKIGFTDLFSVKSKQVLTLFQFFRGYYDFLESPNFIFMRFINHMLKSQLQYTSYTRTGSLMCLTCFLQETSQI